jgi:hypothetical protein
MSRSGEDPKRQSDFEKKIEKKDFLLDCSAKVIRLSDLSRCR